MKEFEEKLKKYIAENSIECEYFSFETSCHSVEDTAKTMNVSPDDIVKNICLVDSNKRIMVCTVIGTDRVSTSTVAKSFGIERPDIASPDEILEKTGYPCGGVPSFGFDAVFLVDPKVMEKKFIYTSGGSENTIIKISPQENIKFSNAKVVKIRK